MVGAARHHHVVLGRHAEDWAAVGGLQGGGVGGALSPLGSEGYHGIYIDINLNCNDDEEVHGAAHPAAVQRVRRVHRAAELSPEHRDQTVLPSNRHPPQRPAPTLHLGLLTQTLGLPEQTSRPLIPQPTTPLRHLQPKKHRDALRE